MKKTEKRRLRTYKATDPVYDKAMNSAKKKGIKLCPAIEKFIVELGESKSNIITVKLTD